MLEENSPRFSDWSGMSFNNYFADNLSAGFNFKHFAMKFYNSLENDWGIRAYDPFNIFLYKPYIELAVKGGLKAHNS